MGSSRIHLHNHLCRLLAERNLCSAVGRNTRTSSDTHCSLRPSVAILSSTPIEEKDWWTNTSVSVDESSSTTDSPVEKDASMDSTESQFHNRGYEVWEQCRTAWRGDRDESAEQQQVSTPTRRSPKALTTYQKRQVTANLARQREYNLPRRLRLDQVVGIYQDIWSQGGSE